jgi:hypothetical protein
VLTATTRPKRPPLMADMNMNLQHPPSTRLKSVPVPYQKWRTSLIGVAEPTAIYLQREVSNGKKRWDPTPRLHQGATCMWKLIDAARCPGESSDFRRKEGVKKKKIMAMKQCKATGNVSWIEVHQVLPAHPSPPVVGCDDIRPGNAYCGPIPNARAGQAPEPARRRVV